jgi:hypothetical protein
VYRSRRDAARMTSTPRLHWIALAADPAGFDSPNATPADHVVECRIIESHRNPLQSL